MKKEFGVAVKAIVQDGDKYLILYKSKIEDINPNEIDIPGGRVEFGENPEEALLREIKEEASLDVEIIKPLRSWSFVKENFQLVGITFLVKYIKGDVIIGDEHKKYEWMTKEYILEGDFADWIKEEFLIL